MIQQGRQLQAVRERLMDAKVGSRAHGRTGAERLARIAAGQVLE